ncbi:MAG: AsnC family transcriptional regulator [Bacteroides sp.]|nr:AsnC family transcriptional regulator [Barnesiella sp.]MBD5314768.1 AsnC family transcriptional regulator [Bacteroides sp.]MDE6249615.1 Lrp/AsnC ligand binding domain-containing protein [Paramuribaculum sp.]MDE7449646.1 Lrp/AsnC ligand binding domain-containing protein [Paramuribaculum sp.]
MARTQFDSLDCKILQRLSLNARKPFLEIARECNVSGAAIHQRTQKLLQSGIIEGFESYISPSAVGYDTCAYIGFILNDPAQSDRVVSELKSIPEVVECHTTTGKYDLFVKLFAHNNDHLLHIIHDKIQPIQGGRTETLISFKEEFRRQVPIEQTSEK